MLAAKRGQIAQEPEEEPEGDGDWAWTRLRHLYLMYPITRPGEAKQVTMSDSSGLGRSHTVGDVTACRPVQVDPGLVWRSWVQKAPASIMSQLHGR